jgi:FdhD protein
MREIRSVPVDRLDGRDLHKASDDILVEEPLEIYVNDQFYTLTMRLVGDEIALATGLCFTDGIIQSADDLTMIRYCGEDAGNRIDLYLSDTADKGSLVVRRTNRASYSSCGVCGSELVLDAGASLKIVEESTHLNLTQVLGCQGMVEEMQAVFKATGGTHGAAIFDAEAKLLSFSEDVGRHNALDKAIGKALLSRIADKAFLVILTSRISYEMVLKAGRLGVEILAAPSAVTSLAVELASRINLTLVGFLRNGGANIYTVPARLTS